MALIDLGANVILLLVIMFIIFIVIAITISAQRNGALSIAGGDRSKLEANIVRMLERITHAKFDQAHPEWLRDPESGALLELDGYNRNLAIALEVQGPGHIKPLRGEAYEKYQKRVARDALKREVCAKHGVRLISMDYRIRNPASIEHYLQSRLYDIGFLAEKPFDYINEVPMIPWQRGH